MPQRVGGAHSRTGETQAPDPVRCKPPPPRGWTRPARPTYLSQVVLQAELPIERRQQLGAPLVHAGAAAGVRLKPCQAPAGRTGGERAEAAGMGVGDGGREGGASRAGPIHTT